MNNKGQHVVLDAYFQHPVTDLDVERACDQAIHQSNMTVISQVKKQFSPKGMTAVWLLAESHFSVHTFPEQNYISVDCYTCGDEGNPMAAIDSLVRKLKPITANIQVLDRG